LKINLDKNRSKERLRVRKMHSQNTYFWENIKSCGLIKKLLHFHRSRNDFLILLFQVTYSISQLICEHLLTREENLPLMHSPFMFDF
jgi:hypothetical protein